MRPARRSAIRRVHPEGALRRDPPAAPTGSCRPMLRPSRRRRSRGCGWALIARLSGSRHRWTFALRHCHGVKNRTLLPLRGRRAI